MNSYTAHIALKAVVSRMIDVLMFIINPTCDTEAAEVAITVMKSLGAGTLLKAESSPFGVAMAVLLCIQYYLGRNRV